MENKLTINPGSGNIADRIANLSPAKLALLQLKLKKMGSPASCSQVIPRCAERESAQLSFAQQRLWILDRLEENSPLYNVPLAFRLSGACDIHALTRSLNEIIRRHEVLRTNFALIDGLPVQRVVPELTLDLPVVDLENLSDEERGFKVDMLVNAEARRPFDLLQEALLRASLFRLGLEEHLLIVVMHHIVTDGWSMGVFLRELAILYGAYSKRKPSPLPDLSIQYLDFAVWQREWLQGEVLATQLAYWREQLAGIPPVLELPADRPRPPLQSYRGALHPVTIPRPLSDGLKSVGRREGATLFMTLLTAFTALLHRYTGQEDIVVGSPIANRNRVEIEGLIGFFANTLVLRADLSENPSFPELLKRIRKTCLEAYSHQDLPFEKLVEELQPERSLSHGPLFQVMFVLQNSPGMMKKLGELQINRLDLRTGSAKFDLTLNLKEGAEGVNGWFEYSTDLFDAATIERMAGQFRTLLEGIVAEPDVHLSDLPLLTGAERHQLLVEWNDTKIDYPRACIHEIFEAQAERTPEAVAVVFEDQQLTYQELDERANRLAHYLIKLGVGPEVIVGICVERSLEMIEGLLGILKAGGAYLPLDPAYPKERVAFMLVDSKALILVTQENLRDKLPETGVVTICIDRNYAAIASILPENPVSVSLSAQPQPHNLAYVIYTSGSTGKPKGVQVPHVCAVNFLASMSRTPGLSDRDVLVAVTTISFDISVLELFLPLSVGAMILLVGREAASDGTRVMAALAASGGTVLQATPVTWRLLIAAGWHGAEGFKALCGGEPFPRDLLDELLRRKVRVWNMYGPTESTVWSSCCELTDSLTTISIGRPIANTRIYILDPNLQPVPVGVSGELYIGGDGVTRGYLYRPEQTRENFISDPFTGEPDVRIYKTGDLARYLPDGRIEVLGRIDHQVKIRGYRIELGEIEVVLASHTEISACVVVVQEKSGGDKALTAFVVQKKRTGLSVGSLRHWLGDKLPFYMIPERFFMVPALPLTPNGKIDRKALEKSEEGELAASTDFVPARDDLESKLVEIWQAVLKRNRIGVHDNFFDLGGHSLQAIRLTGEIEKQLNHKLPITALFQSPTIELLARRLTEEDWKPSWSSLVPLQPLGSKAPLIFTHGWGGDVYGFLGWVPHLGPDQPVYGIQAVGLDGKASRHITVESMATHYVQEILAFQPQGPFYLCGYSLGGLIAFEVAQQLCRCGHRVAMLALVDTYPICGIPWTIYMRVHGRQMASYLGRRCVFHLRRVWNMSNHDRRDYLRGRWAAFQYLISRNRTKQVITVPPPQDSQPPDVPLFGDYYAALFSAYRLSHYPGSAEVFLSDDARPVSRQIWKHIVRGGISFHKVSGGHLQLISSEYLPALAKSMATVLHHAQEKERAACPLGSQS